MTVRPDPRLVESWCGEGVSHDHEACGNLWNPADLRDVTRATRDVAAGAYDTVAAPPPSDRPVTRVTLGPSNAVVITRYPAVVVVVESPDEMSISLDLLATAGDPQSVLFVHGDRIYLGNDPAGNEVVYRVVEWNAEQKALRAVRQP